MATFHVARRDNIDARVFSLLPSFLLPEPPGIHDVVEVGLRRHSYYDCWDQYLSDLLWLSLRGSGLLAVDVAFYGLVLLPDGIGTRILSSEDEDVVERAGLECGRLFDSTFYYTA